MPRQSGLHTELSEMAQRNTTNMIPNLSKRSYKERKEALDLPTLKEKRVRGNIIITYTFPRGHDNAK